VVCARGVHSSFNDWATRRISSAALGQKAIFVYDDGSGEDFPVRNDHEFAGFINLVRSNKNVHGEYDIMILPEGDWSR